VQLSSARVHQLNYNANACVSTVHQLKYLMQKEGKRVVLIDGDIEDIELFIDVLKSIFPAYTCVPFTDACLALEYLKTCKIVPRIVIIDFNLPNMSVEECIADLTSMERLKDTKVIIHSTALPGRNIVDGFSAMGIGFFQKPSSMNEFETMVRNIFR
jgi:DNA-binding NtrC family response regulator